ncbi:uncharacterized protein K02A2.6-like [Mya arenaria]|uniref:uncharacterized protein K02A2.6-like n=1 Tax=Mya arenaria TaxID=6604 RepID=UPI0022DF87A1|nr:uncharacterized protein K02A2.6-like [Mya arenaria]
MLRLNPPESFNFANPVEWPDWKQRFSRFRMATKLHKDDGEVQVSVLVYSMGKEAEHIVKTFEFEEGEEDTDYETVLGKFEKYFVPKRNIIHERAKFHLRMQKEGENVETFVRELYEIAEHCDFTDKNEEIRDRLVIGILDKKLSERLQLKSDLTLDKAIELARQNELVKSQIKDQMSSKLVDAVKAKKPPTQNQPTNRKYGTFRDTQGSRPAQYASGPQKGSLCYKCNRYHARDNCFAKGKKCRNCHGFNHFAVCCRKKKSVHEVHEEDTMFLGSVTNCCDNSPPWTVNLKIHGKDVKFKIDSGADTSVMSHDTFCKLSRQPDLMPQQAVLIGPGGKLDCIGMFRAKTKFKGQWFDFTVHVVKGMRGTNLLGRAVAGQMGVIQKVEEIEVDEGIYGSFGLVKCEPVKIELKKDAKPYCLTTARRVSFPLMEKVEAELNKLESEGIIQKVTQPTDWCAPMVPVRKANGNIRICVDMKKLNDSVKREHYMLPNLDDISPKLSGSKVFSKLDASSGFYQIPLDQESCLLTTFITPMGRYCFKRVPFGITSAPEIFQRKMTDILRDLDGVEVIIDDILVHGKNVKEHDKHLEMALRKIQDSGLKLNKDKCEFRKESIDYFGHHISSDGIQPSANRVTAIRDMVAPSNVKELRRVIGMVNYLGRFIPNLASVIRPMTDLLKGTAAWTWDSVQENAFRQVKELVTNAETLTYYDLRKSVVVSADASSYGLGGALFQDVDGNGQLKPVAFCSRKLTETEKKYAQIEKECLASLWACEKFARYLVGLESFKLLTDHKPLVPLLNSQDLNNCPLRCQRMLMRLRGYSLIAEHVPGKDLVVPDTLSRCPVSNENYEFVNEIECFAINVEALRPVADKRLEEIRNATENDTIIQEAMNFTRYGWPEYMNSVSKNLKDMFASRSELSVSQGLLLYRDRIVIPEELRTEVLASIHEGHLGLNKCRARAQSSVWWPGIAKDIKSKIETCQFCQEHRPAQVKEPLMVTPLPSRPWQRIAADLCEISNKHYLVVTDYYSRFIELSYLEKITSELVIGKMKNMFARWGIPEELVSDNGTQFTSTAFKNFAQEYKFKQTFSSPCFPQANGEAESAVKIAKRILRQSDIFAALMEYRATEIEATGLSPAEMMMGRKIRTLLPALPEKLTPDWIERDGMRLRDARYKERTRINHDFAASQSKPLPELQPGDAVRMRTGHDKSWKTTGIVTGGDPDHRSYQVTTATGTLRRNRRHLQLTSRTEEDPVTRVHKSLINVPSVPLDGEISDDATRVIPVGSENGRCARPVPNPITYGHRDTPVPDQNANGHCDTPVPNLGFQEHSPNKSSPSSPVVTRSGRQIMKPKKYSDFEIYNLSG